MILLDIYGLICIVVLILITGEDRKISSLLGVYPDLRNRVVDYYYKVCFKHVEPSFARPAGEPVIIYSQRMKYLALAVFCAIYPVCAFFVLGWNYLVDGSGPNWLTLPLVLLMLIACLYNVRQYTNRALVYRNCLVVKNCTGQKIFYFNCLDCIETENCVDTNNEASWRLVVVYKLRKGRETLLTLSASKYQNLLDLEQVFNAENPCVDRITVSHF